MCGTTCNLERHHVIFGTANLERHHVIFGTAGRKISDKLGLTIWLCHEHHLGRNYL